MASNNLSIDQEILTRRFLKEVLYDSAIFAGDVAGRQQAIGMCLDLLNYKLVMGKYVEKGTTVTYKLGQEPDVECEWDRDVAKLEARYAEANSTKDQGETSSSEPTTDSALRQTLLPEDV